MLTEVLGPRLAADTGEWGTFAWDGYVLSTPGARIGGGTEEIVRDARAEGLTIDRRSRRWAH